MTLLLGILVGIGGAVFAIVSPISIANGWLFVAIEFIALALVTYG